MHFPRTIDGLRKNSSGFDFLVGSWKVGNSRLKHPLSDAKAEWYETEATARSITLHNGAVSVDEMWFAESGFAATSFRVYESATDTWRIYWVSSLSGILQPPAAGRWRNGKFEARGPDEFEGKSIIARYLWHSITEEQATFEQAFSTDQGASWETNWIMRWSRVAE